MSTAKTEFDRKKLFSVRPDGLTFIACVEAVIATPELLTEIDRLYGSNLMHKGSGVELAIDKATGRNDADFQILLKFTWDCVYTRVPISSSSNANSL